MCPEEENFFYLNGFEALLALEYESFVNRYTYYCSKHGASSKPYRDVIVDEMAQYQYVLRNLLSSLAETNANILC